MKQAENGNSREELAELVDVDMLEVAKLTKELRDVAKTMERREARFLVDAYYQVQDSRTRHSNQRTAGHGEDEPPYVLIDWLASHTAAIECRLAALLNAYASASRVGQWSMSICGIGPIISAGLLAYIDITRAPTVGHIWRYAGLDPTCKWLGKEGAKALVRETLGREEGPVSYEDIVSAAMACARNPESVQAMMARPTKSGKVRPQTAATLVKVLASQPWCANLKTLAWKIGESFVKVSSRDSDFYGKLYVQRKLYEQENNEALRYADQAAHALATKNYKRAARDDDEVDEEQAWKTNVEWYEQGMLPPAQIHARAKRWTAKLFLAHWHEIRYIDEYGRMPPMPYILTVEGGHAHKIEVPNYPDWAKEAVGQ